MSKQNYSELLKDPRWQKKRLEILSLRGFKCENCANEENQLHVHHRFYLKGRKSWEYDNDVLQVLCETCHENEHKKNGFSDDKLNIIKFIDSLDEEDFYHFLDIINYFSQNINNAPKFVHAI